jgi:hypothetical protein
MNIAVFGANGPTGRLVTELALREGHVVSAFTRHPDTFPLRHDNLRVANGDVVDVCGPAANGSRRDELRSRLDRRAALRSVRVARCLGLRRTSPDASHRGSIWRTSCCFLAFLWKEGIRHQR